MCVAVVAFVGLCVGAAPAIVDGSGSVGVVVGVGTVNLTNATVRDSADRGVEVTGGDDGRTVRIEDVDVRGSEAEGLFVEGTRVSDTATVANVTAVDNGPATSLRDDGQDGIRIRRVDSVDIEAAVAARSGASGIALFAVEGAPDGPAAPGETVVADPTTGAAADGSGDAVSTGATDDVADVRFDPFLATDPGVEDERPPPVIGDATPRDPDGDGRYEDVDGNGRVTPGDATALFEGIF